MWPLNVRWQSSTEIFQQGEALSWCTCVAGWELVSTAVARMEKMAKEFRDVKQKLGEVETYPDLYLDFPGSMAFLCQGIQYRSLGICNRMPVISPTSISLFLITEPPIFNLAHDYTG